MIIKLLNKHTLEIDDFQFRCCIGKKGLKKNKKEGDKSTPIGKFKLNRIFYRPDRIKKFNCKVKKIKIKKNMGWCDDPISKKYNRLIKTSNKIKHEKLYRRDNKYDILIELDYNFKKIIPFAGSAIFLHLTKNYKPTAGCIAINLNDMRILIKILDKNNLIEVS
tara:strand:+ start:3635 stop:4126 length:492 start_codon:yes stop_codon:yes gene_type:complete